MGIYAVVVFFLIWWDISNQYIYIYILYYIIIYDIYIYIYHIVYIYIYIWVCLKMWYTPKIAILVMIMIMNLMNHWIWGSPMFRQAISVGFIFPELVGEAKFIAQPWISTRNKSTLQEWLGSFAVSKVKVLGEKCKSIHLRYICSTRVKPKNHPFTSTGDNDYIPTFWGNHWTWRKVLVIHSRQKNRI